MYANSHKQLLSEHSIAVANVALKLFDKLGIVQSTASKKTFENIEAVKEQIFFAGLLHDMGKADKNFQDFLIKKDKNKSEVENNTDGVHIEFKKESDKFSFSNYPRHNEVSWALSDKKVTFINGDYESKYKGMNSTRIKIEAKETSIY